MASAWDHIDINGSIDRGRQRGARRAVEIYLDKGDYGAAADAMTPYDPQGASAIRRIEDEARQREQRRASEAFDREVAPMIARNDIEGAQRLALQRQRPTPEIMRLMELGQKLHEREQDRVRRQAIDTMFALRRMRDLPPAEAQQRYSTLRERLISETPALASNLPETYDPDIAKDLMLRSQDYGQALSYLQAQMEREGMRTLTPQEATGMGFRPGTVVQQKPDGTLNVLQNPESSGGGMGRAPSGYRWGADGSLEPIPGGPADKGPQLAGGDAVRASNALASVGQIRSALDNFRRLVEEADPVALAGLGPKGAALTSAHRALALRMKGPAAFDLGALVGADFAILNDTIGEPGNLIQLARNGGKQGILARLDEVRSFLDSTGQTVRQTYSPYASHPALRQYYETAPPAPPIPPPPGAPPPPSNGRTRIDVYGRPVP